MVKRIKSSTTFKTVSAPKLDKGIGGGGIKNPKPKK